MCRIFSGYGRGTFFFFFSSRRRHTRLQGAWSSDVCSPDLVSEYETFGHELTVVAPISMLRRDSPPYRLTPAGAPVFSPRVLIPAGLSLLQIGRASCRERV